MAGIDLRGPSTVNAAYSPLHNNTIALLGDSIVNANALQISTATSTYMWSWGFWNWANVLLRQRFHTVGVYGYSGQTTTTILSHLSDALANNPRFLLHEGGVNDVQAGSSSASIIANRQALYAATKAAGVVLIDTTILPCGSLTSSPNTAAAKQQVIDEVNAWIMSEGARTKGVIVVPWHQAIVDYTTGQPLATTTQDGTHPTTYGAQLIGQYLATTLANLLPDVGGQLPVANTDYTNAITNGLFAGTSGFLNFSGNAGVGSTWQVNTTGTQTVVPSKAARTDGFGSWQQLQITAGTPSAADGTNEAHLSWGLSAFPSSGGIINQGDLVYAQVEFQTDADFANAAMLDFQLRDASTNNKAWAMRAYSGADTKRLGGLSGVLRTPTLVAPSTALTMFLFVSGLTGGSTATIRVGRAGVFKVRSGDGLVV